MAKKYAQHLRTVSKLLGYATVISIIRGVFGGALVLFATRNLDVGLVVEALLAALAFYALGMICDYLADMAPFLDNLDSNIVEMHNWLEASRKRAAEKQRQPVSDK